VSAVVAVHRLAGLQIGYMEWSGWAEYSEGVDDDAVADYDRRLRSFANGEVDRFTTVGGAILTRLRYDDKPDQLEVLASDGVRSVGPMGRVPEMLLAIAGMRTVDELAAVEEMGDEMTRELGLSPYEMLHPRKRRN
jgi:hypothetical protein